MRNFLGGLLVMLLATCGQEHGPAQRADGGARGVDGHAPVAPQRVYALRDAEDFYDVSPDGRLGGYIDWNTGNLMVRDLTTGAVRDLTKKGTYETTGNEAESALFSPDAKLIAYEWWDAAGKFDELRVVGVDGSNPHAILRTAHGKSIWTAAWTPDGKSIATFVDDSAGARSVQLVPLDGTAPRTLLQVDHWDLMGGIHFSSDGKTMAYTAAREPSRARTDIYLMDVASGDSHLLLKSDAPTSPLAWRNGGLIFASERGGTPGIWSLPVRDGKATGEPELIRGEIWRMTQLRLTDAGQFFYTVSSGDRDVLTASFDPATGKLLSQPQSITHRPGEDYAAPTWSDDGQYVAYITRRKVPTVTIRALDGSQFREYKPHLSRLGTVRWVPNKNMLMLGGQDENGTPDLYLLDLKTEMLHRVPGIGRTSFSFSPDGSMLYYAARDGGSDAAIRLVARDLDSGAEKLIARAPAGRSIGGTILTADGGKTLVVTGFRPGYSAPLFLYAVPATGGAMHELTHTLAIDTINDSWRAVGITPDNKSVLMASRAVKDADWKTWWRLPLDGSTPVKLGPMSAGIAAGLQNPGGLVSRDGRHITYATGSLRTELWMLEEPRLALHGSSAGRN